MAIRGHQNITFLQRDHQTVSIVVNFDEDGLRILGELLQVPRLHQATAPQNDDSVTGAFDIDHQVGRKQHTDAELPVCLPDKGQHLFPSNRVESGRRLVEKHDRRVVYQGLRKFYPLLHSGGVTAHRPVPFFEQPGVPQCVRRTDARAGRWKTAHLGDVRQELGGRHGARQAVVFRHVSESGAYGDALGCVLTENRRRTRSRLEQTEKDLERGGFACAVLTENAGDPVGYVEADVIERYVVVVVLREVLSDQEC